MQHGVTFSFGSAKVCSPAMLETSFSYDKDIWIAATDYCINFYITMLFSLTSILAVVTLTFKILSLLFLRNHTV